MKLKKRHKNNKNLDMNYGEKNKMKDNLRVINKVQTQYLNTNQKIIPFKIRIKTT